MPLDESKIGSVVRFYRDGWRCGHLEELDDKFARIRPIGGGSSKHRLAKIPLFDVEEMEQSKLTAIHEPAAAAKEVSPK
jgi:hypothetical protein